MFPGLQSGKRALLSREGIPPGRQDDNGHPDANVADKLPEVIIMEADAAFGVARADGLRLMGPVDAYPAMPGRHKADEERPVGSGDFSLPVAEIVSPA